MTSGLCSYVNKRVIEVNKAYNFIDLINVMASILGKRLFKATGHNCCAVGCNHKSAVASCSFFSFPKDKTWLDKWVDAVKRCAVDENGKVLPNKRWVPESHHRLCSCHFSSPPNPVSRRLGWNHVIPDRLPGVKSHTPRSTRTRSYSQQLLKRRRLAEEVCWINFLLYNRIISLDYGRRPTGLYAHIIITV
jgi:hypothetical protein